MKISEINNDYLEATGKLSELVRQLDFAGIGVIWIFTVGKDSGGFHYSTFLLIPLACFVLSLGFDLSQYAYKSLLLGILNHHYWKKHGNMEQDVEYFGFWNWVSLALFWSKAGFVVLGYIFLFAFICWQIYIHGISDSSDDSATRNGALCQETWYDKESPRSKIVVVVEGFQFFKPNFRVRSCA